MFCPIIVSFRYSYRDSYALVPGIIFCSILFYSLNGFKGPILLFLRFTFMALFVSYFMHSVELAKSWRTDEELWAYTFTVDRTWMGALFFSQYQYNKNPEKCFELLDLVKDLKPPFSKKIHVDQFDTVYSITLSKNKNLSLAKKIEYLEHFDSHYHWKNYILTHLYLQNGQFEKALKIFLTITVFPFDRGTGTKVNPNETYNMLTDLKNLCPLTPANQSCTDLHIMIDKKLAELTYATPALINSQKNTNLDLNFLKK
jgi:hypothetical protein